MNKMTKSLPVLKSDTTKAYGIREKLECKGEAPIEVVHPGEMIRVYVKRPLLRGYRNRFYASVRTKKGKDGYILAEAIYRTEG